MLKIVALHELAAKDDNAMTSKLAQSLTMVKRWGIFARFFVCAVSRNLVNP